MISKIKHINRFPLWGAEKVPETLNFEGLGRMKFDFFMYENSTCFGVFMIFFMLYHFLFFLSGILCKNDNEYLHFKSLRLFTFFTLPEFILLYTIWCNEINVRQYENGV